MRSNLSFGEWVRQQRKALDLTQEALALEIGCALSMLQKVETSQRRPSRQLAERLAQFLQIPEADYGRFMSLARADAAPLTPQPAQQGHLLPQALTPMFGRELEASQLLALLRREPPAAPVRLLTLTGPGGTGKTRLALHLAELLADEFADGVVFVDLTPLRDPQLVIPTLVRALDYPEPSRELAMDTLAAIVRDKHMLILLDNFEHVATAAVAIAEVLHACPAMTMLITSREPLHVHGEQQYAVPPLAVPDPATDRAAAATTPAVALFVARSQALQADFRLTEDNTAAVIEICRRLDGLPLAIELAAARTRVLPPAVLLARLDHRLDVLKQRTVNMAGRHQTLRSTIAWSHQLLTPAEQQIFQRIAVFVGGMTLDAAEAVIHLRDLDGQSHADHSAASLSALEGLEGLIDKSLLQAQTSPNNQMRFRMLETIREFALEQLVASGEEMRARRAHASFFLLLGEHIAPELSVPQQGALLVGLDREQHNVRAALDWWSDDPEGGVALVRLTAMLGRFWYGRGYWRKGRTRLANTLGRFWYSNEAWREGRAQSASGLTGPPGSVTPATLASYWIGGLATAQKTELVQHSLQRSIEIVIEQDPLMLTHILTGLGSVARHAGESLAALALYQEALAQYTSLDHTRGSGRVLSNLGVMWLFEGDYPQARAVLEAAQAIWREQDYAWGIASGLYNLGEVAQAEGDVAQAEQRYIESLAVAQELEAKPLYTMTLLSLGHMHLAGAKYVPALDLFHKALPLCQSLGAKEGLLLILVGVAEVVAARGELAVAARISGAVTALKEALDAHLESQDRATYQRTMDRIQALIKLADFASEWREGHALTADQVTRAVLAQVFDSAAS